ncbi:MAG: cell division protein FtsZ [Firmicutes bacterium]|nr:cell division protein FtsZ [Bacillota bacterium]HAL62833.1 cell division protein FtsZ [Clostridiales bacterium]
MDNNIERTPETAVTQPTDGARIKVIGIGGGGNNAVDRMIEANVAKAEFIAVNTDLQQLKTVKAPIALQIGARLTQGLGAGAKPEIGQKAAEETENAIKELLENTEMVFITAGMGGGTGTGAAPVIAKLAKDMGILTVAVVTKPFFFEGPQRARNAEQGIENLAANVDAIVTIPNDLLLKTADKKISITDSFRLADEVLRQGVEGIIEVIAQNGIISCDFADVSTVMRDSGVAHMGIGIGKGENAAQDAVRAAIESPLLETSIAGAHNVLLNITGGTEFSLVDMGEVSSIVREMVSQDATIIVGTAVDENMKDEIKVTLIATGLNAKNKRGVKSEPIIPGMPKTPDFGSRTPSFSPVNDDDAIFSRTLKKGMDSVNVPSFFKTKND